MRNLPDVSGGGVTIDTMGCRKQPARQIVGREAGYVLADQENQRQRRADVVDRFSGGQRTEFEAMAPDCCRTPEQGRRRTPGGRPGVSGIPLLRLRPGVRRPKDVAGGSRPLGYREFRPLGPGPILSFREDESRVRAGDAPENLAIIRHAALTRLRKERFSRLCWRAGLGGISRSCGLGSGGVAAGPPLGSRFR